MRPEDAVRIRHLAEATTKAIGSSTGHIRADLDSDEVLRLALTKLVEIVGEAAKQVSQAGQPSSPDRLSRDSVDRRRPHA
jgi:uncharacterized protein with HEPN domain